MLFNLQKSSSLPQRGTRRDWGKHDRALEKESPKRKEKKES